MSVFRSSRFFGPICLAALFIIMAAGIYGPSLHNGFQPIDDELLITQNPIIRQISPASLKQAFTTYDPELYIPLTLVAYQLIYQVGGLHPFWYHLVSLALHVTNALLVTWLLFLLVPRGWNPAAAYLGARRTMIIIAGLMFLVHPLHVEAVAWAAALKDVLSATFFFGALIAYLHYRQGKTMTYRWSIELFLLGLLAKVMVITLPVVLLLIDLLQERKWDRRILTDKIPFAVLSAIFGVIAIFGKTDTAGAVPWTTTLLLGAKNVSLSLAKFIVPFPLSIVYPQDTPVTIASFEFLLPVALVLTLIALAFLTYKRMPAIAAGIGFFLITLAPTIFNIAKEGGFYITSDRYMYIPSVGLLFLGVLIVSRLMEQSARPALNRIIFVGFLGLIGFFGFISHQQSLLWRDGNTLFTYALRFHPHSSIALANRGAARARNGDMRGATDDFRAAIARYPTSIAMRVSLADTLALQGDLQGALAEYQSALQQQPLHPDIHLGLGLLFRKMGRNADAQDAIRNAYALDPDRVRQRLMTMAEERGEDTEFLLP